MTDVKIDKRSKEYRDSINREPDGRPTDYSDEKADQMCDIIASNPKSVQSLCDLYPDIFPATYQTVFLWLTKHPYFSDKYDLAKQHQQKVCLEKMIVVAETASADNIAAMDKKIYIDTMKWQAARLDRKRYGDTTSVELTKTNAPEEVKARLDKLIKSKKKEY